METFAGLKNFAENPQYKAQRQESLAGLKESIIDAPIKDLILGFNKLPFCFTLQSCCGHFVYNGENDPENLAPLPNTDDIDCVEYRIAYIAFCIENSPAGKRLFAALKKIPAIDSNNIQFCCAEWFWKRQVNSYALQVEPERFRRKDSAILEYTEALHIQNVRNMFFNRLYDLLN